MREFNYNAKSLVFSKERVFMADRMSGERLFLLYAFPCAIDSANSEHQNGISAEKIEKLKFLVDNNIKPERSFLEECFPQAVQNLRSFAKRHTPDCDMWALDTVKTFWRYAHNEYSDCKTCLVQIVSVNKNIAVANFCGKEIFVINQYGLELQPGDQVFCHRHVVIEKKE